MIVNKINCLLSSRDIEALKRIKSSEVNIYSEVLDSKTSLVKLQDNNSIYFIVNIPTEQMDGDEYPVLKLDTDSNIKFNSNFILEKVKLLHLYLIRDKLAWVRDGIKWDVEVDIGMKIVTDKKEVSFIAMDSVGGLMELTFANDIEIQCSKLKLKEHWIFKSDTFINLKRTQISLF